MIKCLSWQNQIISKTIASYKLTIVHIMIGLIDNLCHEITFHKHDNMNYDLMTELVIDNIKNLFKNDLI